MFAAEVARVLFGYFSLYYLFLSFLLSPRRRWSGGAMVLDNFQCRGSYNLDDSRARAYYTCSRCGWGLFGHFYSPLSFSPLSPSLWETVRYRLKYCLKGPLNPKQPTNHRYTSARDHLTYQHTLYARRLQLHNQRQYLVPHSPGNGLHSQVVPIQM